MIEQLAQALDGVEPEASPRPAPDSVESAGVFAELLGQLRSERPIGDDAGFERPRPWHPPDPDERVEAAPQAIIAPTVESPEPRIEPGLEFRSAARFASGIAKETARIGSATSSPEVVAFVPAPAPVERLMHEAPRTLAELTLPPTSSSASTRPAPIIPQTLPIERVPTEAPKQSLAVAAVLPIGSRPVLRAEPLRVRTQSEALSETGHEELPPDVVDRQETGRRPPSENASAPLGVGRVRTLGLPLAPPSELQSRESSQALGEHTFLQPDRSASLAPSTLRLMRQGQQEPAVVRSDPASLATPTAPVVAPPTAGAAVPAQIAASGPVETVIPAQIEWLASRGGGSARVVLHPAALGEVEISVRVRGDVVEVAIRAQEPEARAALLTARDQLDVALVARELRVESIEIRSTEPRLQGDASLADRPSSGDGSAGPESGGGRAREEARPAPSGPDRSPAQASLRSHPPGAEASRHVDLHV